jgi:hypothetical protein
MYKIQIQVMAQTEREKLARLQVQVERLMEITTGRGEFAMAPGLVQQQQEDELFKLNVIKQLEDIELQISVIKSDYKKLRSINKVLSILSVFGKIDRRTLLWIIGILSTGGLAAFEIDPILDLIYKILEFFN